MRLKKIFPPALGPSKPLQRFGLSDMTTTGDGKLTISQLACL